MRPVHLLYALGLLVLLGCAPTPEATPTPAPTAGVSNQRALIQFQGDHFSASGNCAICHTSLKDESGQDVSIDTHWRSTMMANAARDPYYLATVHNEVNQVPEYQAAIETKCATCHLAMAFTTANAQDKPVEILDDGFLNSNHPYHPLAQDGVSCTACHQIEDHQLGQPESFSGGYRIDTQTSHGERLTYGPYETSQQLSALMQNVSGYIPEQAGHLASAEFCAVCHTLFTNTITEEGEVLDHLFPEQTPYLEWLHSDYAEDTACQDCHMPSASSPVRIANTGGEPRSPFTQHHFVGGNVYMVRLLKHNPDAMAVTATNEQFTFTEELTLQQLEQDTAQLTISASQRDAQLELEVQINSLVGHKFPSGFPSRRAWLHVLVKDANGNAVFESGEWDEQGAIRANDNDMDGSQYEPHYDLIDSPEQVQIYESIMGNPDSQATTSLMRAHHYLKDNRLLPSGFDKASADTAIQVAGDAASDMNFGGGSDTIQYHIQTGDAPGPYTVLVELVYQPAGYRWLHKFSGDDSAEAVDFLSYLTRMTPEPALVARQEIQFAP